MYCGTFHCGVQKASSVCFHHQDFLLGTTEVMFRDMDRFTAGEGGFSAGDVAELGVMKVEISVAG